MEHMDTTSIETTKAYALTAEGECSVTLTSRTHSVTWQALSAGGQTTFIVPAGATVTISDPNAVLTPLPANFKFALGAGVGSIGGEPLTMLSSSEGEATTHMRHGIWVVLPENTLSCRIYPQTSISNCYAMQVLFTPAEDVPAPSELFAGAEWLYKAPIMPSGYTYVITLVQFPVEGAPRVFANLSATIPNGNN